MIKYQFFSPQEASKLAAVKFLSLCTEKFVNELYLTVQYFVLKLQVLVTGRQLTPPS